MSAQKILPIYIIWQPAVILLGANSMLESVIKRDGRTEAFIPHKLNHWGQWASETLGDRVNWTTTVLDAVKGLTGTISTQELQKYLIKACLNHRSWPYNLMAGKLYAALIRKELYGSTIPTIKELHTQLANLGYMRHLDYSDLDYLAVENIIDHTRDFTYAHFQIHHIYRKYSIQNRTTHTSFETPQFTYMRMAMALAEDEPLATRLESIKAWYDHLSFNRISAPTPNYVNLGTPHNGYASCCLYTTDDTAPSLAIGDHIAYTMTYMSSGIGSNLNTRSLGDPVRNGLLEHQGKLPYYKSLAGAVKANLQAGRGGACTAYFSCFDPEAPVIALLQNPTTPKDKQNRDIHFAVLLNRLFAKKVAKNEDIFTFNIKTAPDLTKLFYSGDQDAFELLYYQYEQDPNFKKNYTSARKLMIIFGQQSYDVGTFYYAFIDEINRHTPFIESIYSSNLCLETILPTSPYQDMKDLYAENDTCHITILLDNGNKVKLAGNILVNTNRGNIFAYQLLPGDNLRSVDYTYPINHTSGNVTTVLEVTGNGEIALCNLAGINITAINSDEEYASAMRYALKMIDKTIFQSKYVLPHLGYTAKQRLNAGVGIIGLAYHLAKRGLNYTSQAGRDEIHRVAETHCYHAINESLKLGQELGNAPWMHKTKWPDGWLPIDTYKKTVDEVSNPGYQYDWEDLRQRIILNKGIRHSSLIAYMPTESSSKASSVPNSVYPIRDLAIRKTDLKNVIDWTAPDSDLLADKYQIAWDIPSTELIKVYAIIQKFTDQGISADLYRDRSVNIEISSTEIIQEFLAMVKYGLKTRYYQNSYVVSPVHDENQKNTEQAIAMETSERGCSGGSCTL
jgi:ribonucleoside-diphosphate reductase alpha chain